MSDSRIGFIGAGQIGGPMVGRLLESGFQVRVSDVSESARTDAAALGAEIADSTKSLADQESLILTSLPTPDVLRAVALGPGGLVEGTAVRTVVDLSTVGPATSRDVAAGLKEASIDFVDAPVAGGIPGARAGTLAMMVAGDEAAVQRARPVLSALGKVFYLGAEPGKGQAMKLFNNFLGATAMAATAEIFVIGAEAGLDPKQMLDIFNAGGTAKNTATEAKFPKSVLDRSFQYGFTTRLMKKDIDLLLEETNGFRTPNPIAKVVADVWARSAELNGEESDFTTIVKYFEEAQGDQPHR